MTPFGAWADSLWFDAQNAPRPVARQAVQRLSAARDDGLLPSDYAAETLAQLVRNAGTRPLQAAEVPAADGQLTRQVEHYLHDLHAGRVNPRTLGARYSSADGAVPFDASAVLRDALQAQNLDQAWRAATPRTPMYDDLHAALRRYLRLERGSLWKRSAGADGQVVTDAEGSASMPVAPQRKANKKHPAAQTTAGSSLAEQRLVALGDLSAADLEGSSASGKKAFQAGVRSFQQRHGLAATGVLDAATRAQLEVPPSSRAEQIALTMERMRWTPVLKGRRSIVVNVPEFYLRAYDNASGQAEEKLGMRVIVGKSLDTRTPLFDEDMRYIEFSPYWNVPPSIERKELVPHLRRDPGYLKRGGFEIVTAGGGVTTSASAGVLNAVLAGKARIRQRPGPKNALGDVKFVFPNNSNIYLHHTSSPGLFSRTRRDLSHGCIRVEEPVQLAEFVLQDDPAWTEERIRKAMDRGQPTTARLKEPLPVVITYNTAVVRDGKVYFLGDLYGQDRVLAQALSHQGTAGKAPKSAKALQKNDSPRKGR